MTKGHSHPRKLWRVFYTRPRAEKKCRDELVCSGIEVFLPVRKVIRQWNDRKKEVIEALFTSYIFAQVDESERLRVLASPHVVRAVAFDGKVAVVQPEEIAQLKLLQASPAELEAVALNRFSEGTSVMVTSGPLKGVKGFVMEHRKDTYLLVEVPSISQGVKLQIPADWVTPID